MVIVIGIFIIGTLNRFIIHEKFTFIPLNFDPFNSTSSYNWNGGTIKIQGGFVKGKIIDDHGIENLVLRSLSPLSTITIKGNDSKDQSYPIRIENVNALQIKVVGSQVDKQEVVEAHTILVVLNLKEGEERTIKLSTEVNPDFTEFIILGDNRNGYQTFSQIIDQINAINPLFVIDNGDLVYGGEPNKYRLFYETVAKLRVPLYTTLGNHDIRVNGRPTYTKLFGPPDYSFDYENNHFTFIDSSRGWAEKRALSDAQYAWLENDLKSAAGKQIYVITHIPPTDPRSGIKPNKLPEVPGIEETGYFENLMNSYNQYKSSDHGFPSVQEAERFESLMTKYHVDTVVLSHIHSYFSYVKGDVRYIISGGAGAELLSTNSYYHYLRIKLTKTDNLIEMIQLPSPKNTLQDRYIAL